MDQTKKANTNTSPEMKISCNMKQGTQTVEIKDKTNEKTAPLISTVCELFFTKEVPCFILQDIFISGEVLILAFFCLIYLIYGQIYFVLDMAFFHLFCL